MSPSLHRRIPYVLVLLGLAGFAIGSYLAIAHWGDQPIACGGVGDCGYVNSSEYASVGGVPVAGLGALLYLTMALTAVAWIRLAEVDWLPIAYWGLALAGAGYAGYLTLRRAGRAARDLRLVRHVGDVTGGQPHPGFNRRLRRAGLGRRK